MKVLEAIRAASADVGPLGKARTAPASAGGYKYRGIEDIMNAVHGVFLKHKLTVVPKVLRLIREERTSNNGKPLVYTIAEVQYTFYGEDGSHVESIVVGEGMDSGDKASNKAMSAAYKYAIGQALAIPFEATDSEADGLVLGNQSPRTLPIPPPGNYGPAPRISPKQCEELAEAMRAGGVSWAAVSGRFGISKLSLLEAVLFAEAKKFILGG